MEDKFFTIGNQKWIDITSYSRDSDRSNPTSWELRTGEIRICITNGHRDYKPEWIFHCYILGFNTISLKQATTKEDAAKLAIKLCKGRVKNLYDLIFNFE